MVSGQNFTENSFCFFLYMAKNVLKIKDEYPKLIL